MIGPQNQGFYIRPDRIRQVAAWVAASCVQNKGEGGVATVGFTRAVHTTQRVLYDHRRQYAGCDGLKHVSLTPSQNNFSDFSPSP